MIASLPARSEYFRPTRARELRAKAAALQQWAGVLLGPAVLAGLAASIPLWVLFMGAARHPGYHAFGFACTLGVPAVILLFVRGWLVEAAASRVMEAQRLEAEHQTREVENAR